MREKKRETHKWMSDTKMEKKKNNAKKWKDYVNVKEMHLKLTLYRDFPVLAEH